MGADCFAVWFGENVKCLGYTSEWSISEVWKSVWTEQRSVRTRCERRVIEMTKDKWILGEPDQMHGVIKVQEYTKRECVENLSKRVEAE